MRLVKIIMCLLVFVVAVGDLAAQQKIWRVGLHLGNGYYQLYNKNDWNADPILIYPVKGSPNNLSVGVTTTYTWGKHLGLYGGLLITKKKQVFQAAKDPSSPDPLEFLSISNEFNLLQMPINVQFSTNNEAKHQIVISIGLQTSFLLKYKEHFLQRSAGFYSENMIINKVSRDIDNPGNSSINYTGFLYNRFLFGLNSSINYRLRFKDNWFLDFGICSSTDLTNAENLKVKSIETNRYFWTSGIKRYGLGGDISTRPKTHHRSVGLFISASIPVDIR